MTHRFQKRPRALGISHGTTKRRINLYLPAEDFEKIMSRAEALECGPGAVAAEIVRAWCAQEPPPIFIGADERS